MRPGQRVGKYVLGERIARGGMAEVWAARVEGPQGFVKAVALKFVVDTGDPEMERLFVNEARVAAGLQHPNLVTVFDFDRVADDGLEPSSGPGATGRYYLAMERIEGHDLRRVLRVCRERSLRFPLRLSLYVAGEVLKGLRYVHERPPQVGTERGVAASGAGQDGGGVGATLVHRDVSPHNILVAYTGDVKLSDFGIAKVVTRVPGVQSGLVRGKVAYASPEQLLGRAVDHRSDQFSLGVTLWELLAGRRLFAGTTDVETMNRVLVGDVPALPGELEVPVAIEEVVQRMLAAEAERRYDTTAAALAAVTGLPGYSGDGQALGAWMRDQFARPSMLLPATQLLAGPSPSAGRGSAVRRAASSRLPDPGEDSAGRGPADEPAVVPAVSATVSPAVVRAAAGGTGRRRSPGPHSVPVVIDFATRAPLGSGRPAWARLGMVAALLAVATWGAVLWFGQSVRVALDPGGVPARGVRGAASGRHPRWAVERDRLGRDRSAEPSTPGEESSGPNSVGGDAPGSGSPAADSFEPAPPQAAPSVPSEPERSVAEAAPSDDSPTIPTASGGGDAAGPSSEPTLDPRGPGPGPAATASMSHRTTRGGGTQGLSPNGAPIIE